MQLRRLRDLEEFKEREKHREDEAQRRLQEADLARKRHQSLQESRKKKLGNAFALDDEDDDDDERQRLEKELQLANSRKPPARSPDWAPRDSSCETPGSSSAIVSASAASTATDIDGSMHDHKFAKVWKDWDSKQGSNPGDVARQFMKIAAIKRRGVDAPRNYRD